LIFACQCPRLHHFFVIMPFCAHQVHYHYMNHFPKASHMHRVPNESFNPREANASFQQWHQKITKTNTPLAKLLLLL
jgi:hypothetical protein